MSHSFTESESESHQIESSKKDGSSSKSHKSTEKEEEEEDLIDSAFFPNQEFTSMLDL